MPSLLYPVVAYSRTDKTEIEGRRTRAKHYYDRNLGGTPHHPIQPGQWVHTKPSPQHKHLAWPHGAVEKVPSLRSYTACGYPSWKDTQESSRDRIGFCSAR